MARKPRTELEHEIAVSDEAAAYIADALMQLALDFESSHYDQIRRHNERHVDTVISRKESEDPQ
jgi:hypothetical protein